MNDIEDIAADWRLTAERVSVFRGRQTVLDGVSLSLAAGECLSIIGPNGSGKTTLLLTLLGRLSPTAGRIRLNDLDLANVPPRQRGRFAAYVPQAAPLTPAFTIYDVVAGGRYPHVRAGRRLAAPDHAAVQQALEQCGLTALADRTFDTLSGGERQKTLLAAAIAQDPRVLVMDEPTTALDPAYQIDLVRILRAWQSAGRSLLVVSHDLQLPAALGGRVIALRAGRMVAEGPTSDVLTASVLSTVYAAPFGTTRTPDGQQIVLPKWWRCPPHVAKTQRWPAWPT